MEKSQPNTHIYTTLKKKLVFYDKQFKKFFTTCLWKYPFELSWIEFFILCNSFLASSIQNAMKIFTLINKWKCSAKHTEKNIGLSSFLFACERHIPVIHAENCKLLSFENVDNFILCLHSLSHTLSLLLCIIIAVLHLQIYRHIHYYYISLL